MSNRMIVGFDGSDASINALEWAAGEAALRGASVRVVSSYAPAPVLDFGYGAAGLAWADDDIAEWTSKRLDEAVARAFGPSPSVGHEVSVVGTRPETLLLQEAQDADLVVVGSSGAGAIGRVILGSVTGALLAASPCPVVVTPTKLREATNRIVVGTDGSEHAARAIDWAVAEADRRRCELVVAHAWEHPHRVSVRGAGGRDDMDEVDAELVLEQAIRATRELTASKVDRVLVEGGAAQSLLDLAETADLVVVGSRGRGGFRSMLFGSIAHAMAEHSSCPAVIVR